MKVLWLMPYFGLNSIGGAELSNLNYIHDLDEFDHVVITNHFKSKPGKSEFQGVSYYNLYDDQIIPCIKNESPDVIICTHELVVFPSQLNIPYFIYLHDPRSGCSNLLTNYCNLDCTNCVNYKLHNSFYLSFQKANKIICCSKYLIDISMKQLKQFIHQEPIYPNIRLSPFINDVNPKIIGLSSAALHKGSDLLENLLIRFPSYKFIVCGNSRLSKSFPNVEYTGYLDNIDIHDKFYSRVGTYVSLATNGEAFGMTIVEAFSNRLPVLFPYADGIVESAGFEWFSVPYTSRSCIDTWSNYLFKIVESSDIRNSLINESYSVIKRYKKMKSESINSLKNLLINI